MDSVINAAVIYLLLWIVVRLTGRKTLGELSTFEFLLLLIIGGAVQRTLLGPDFSLTNAAIVVATLVAIHALVTFAEQRSPGFAKIALGVPIILIENGRPVGSQLRNAGVSEDDVMKTARLGHGIERIEDIKFAILEAGGSISIIPRERAQATRIGRPPRVV